MQLEEENLRLKKLFADLSLDKAMLREVMAKRADAVEKVPSGRSIRLCAEPVGCVTLLR